MEFTKYSESDLVRFYGKIDDSMDCWQWVGAIGNNEGHGFISHNGKEIYAHRMSLEIDLGRELLKGMKACHKPGICHNPSCVNPLHLYEGTHADNMADKSIDGTASRKLTAEQVIAVRSSNKPQVALAAEYGVHKGTISEIINRKTWKHLPPASVGPVLTEEEFNNWRKTPFVYTPDKYDRDR